jgi:hypothetical protein
MTVLWLTETLDTMVPLLCEVGDFIPLVTFQGNLVITPSFPTEPACQPGKGNGGFGPSYAWSRGLGFETSPIKTRSARKKASLPPVTLDPTTSTVLTLGHLED